MQSMKVYRSTKEEEEENERKTKYEWTQIDDEYCDK
jgi:hypothetical protein